MTTSMKLWMLSLNWKIKVKIKFKITFFTKTSFFMFKLAYYLLFFIIPILYLNVSLSFI